MFSDCLDDGTYDDWRTLRLFRDGQASGILVPLSPASREHAAVFFTANYTAESRILLCTANIYARLASLKQARLGCKRSAPQRNHLALTGAVLRLLKAYSSAGQFCLHDSTLQTPAAKC